MQGNIENDSAIDSFFCAPCCDIDVEMNLFLKKWDDLMQSSFQEVKPSKNRRPGVDAEVKDLLKKESWVRKNFVVVVVVILLNVV